MPLEGMEGDFGGEIRRGGNLPKIKTRHRAVWKGGIPEEPVLTRSWPIVGLVTQKLERKMRRHARKAMGGPIKTTTVWTGAERTQRGRQKT